MSEARKIFTKRPGPALVSRQDLARILEAQAAQLDKLERMLRSIGATDPEEAAE